MRFVNRLLFVLHMLIGIGGIVGGLAAIINPYEPLGAGTNLLKDSPFDNYLVPGIILFAIIGLGNIACAVLLCLKPSIQGYTSSVVSWALVIWIVVQCFMIKTIAIPHVLTFSIGLIQAFLSAAILFEQKLFPSGIIIDLFKKYGYFAKQ